MYSFQKGIQTISPCYWVHCDAPGKGQVALNNDLIQCGVSAPTPGLHCDPTHERVRPVHIVGYPVNGDLQRVIELFMSLLNHRRYYGKLQLLC